MSGVSHMEGQRGRLTGWMEPVHMVQLVKCEFPHKTAITIKYEEIQVFLLHTFKYLVIQSRQQVKFKVNDKK